MPMEDKKTKEVNGHLPEEIIIQILRRLPVRYLLRFKCVSTRWRFIISDPEFAKSQFKLASEQKTLTRRLLLSSASQLQSLDLETPSFGDSSSSVRNLDLPFKEAEMLGSCNGLVCLALNSHSSNQTLRIYICNPSTGFYHILPNPSFASQRNPSQLANSGFGYVPATNDYKLVLNGWLFDDPTKENVEIYSLRTNSWKRIEAPMSSHGIKGAFANEALYWLVELDDIREKILCFDLANEDFREISVPVLNQDDSGNFESHHYLVTLEGCLCVMWFTTASGPKDIEIWSMREDGLSESWSKVFKFRIEDECAWDITGQNLSFDPVYYTESGTIVLLWYNVGTIHHELVRFDKNEDGVDEVVVCSGRYRTERKGLEMIVFDETLLSLDS